LSPGTFVFRPPFREDTMRAEGLKHDDRPMLWHPIKE
jgi:hypothetical protein